VQQVEEEFNNKLSQLNEEFDRIMEDKDNKLK